MDHRDCLGRGVGGEAKLSAQTIAAYPCPGYRLLEEQTELFDEAKRTRQIKETFVLLRRLPQPIHYLVGAQTAVARLDLPIDIDRARTRVDRVTEDGRTLGDVANSLDLQPACRRKRLRRPLIKPQQDAGHRRRIRR